MKKAKYTALLALLLLVSSGLTSSSRPSSFGAKPLEGINHLETAFGGSKNKIQSAYESYGLSKNDYEFLLSLRRPLLTSSEEAIDWATGNGLRHNLRVQFMKDFKQNRSSLDERVQLSDRQAQIAYAVIRVNGSMPTYHVRYHVPDDLRSLILGTIGNCSDYSIRLMFLLESIGVHAVMASVVTKEFPGHVVVDAYDPVEDVSYILDATFNVVLIKPNSKGRGFLRQALSPNYNSGLLADYTIITLPVFFSSLSMESRPEFSAYDLHLLNAQLHMLRQRWQKWVQNDMDELLTWWKKTPSHRPASLFDLQALYLKSIPKDFSTSIDHARALRDYLGLPYMIEVPSR